MTLDEIDREMADWKTKLQLVSDNLLALTGQITYQRLTGEGGWPKAKLTGATEARVAPALAGMKELWSQYALLSDLVDRASGLRGSVSRLLPSRATLQEIEELLRGSSIHLPASALPLERRGLLTAAEVARSVTPQRLLEAMTACFEAARDAVLAADAAWNRLIALLDGCDAEAVALAQLAGALGADHCAALEAVKERSVALRGQVEEDPLGAAGASEEIAGQLSEIRVGLGQMARERDEIQAELAGASDLIRRLAEAHAQAKQAWAERELKVQVDHAAVFPKPLEDGAVAALAPWLAKLESTVRAGNWKAARVGLKKWTGIANEYFINTEAARSANRAPLHVRRDLRGLLEALKAKAHACGRAEDVELAALAQEAWQLLQNRPTPLERARQLVAEYEARLL